MQPEEQKYALVLGGSLGIGATVVKRFAAEGINVHFTYAGSREAAVALSATTGATASRVDSANRSSLTAFMAEQKPIDILVINAGTLIMGDPLQVGNDHMIDVNVRAPHFAAIEGVRRMRDGGRIIVIGSVNADRMPLAGGAGYAMSKAAMQGLVRGLARDFGERNITINNVQPGPVDTDMNPERGPMGDLMHSFLAIKRHARTREIASFVAFLAGPEAGYITGSSQTIDGGFSA